MSDLMREEFEAWQLQTYCGGKERLKKCKNDDAYYYYTDVQLKWKAWQASRESLVVELPPSISVAPIGGEGIQECLDCNGEYLHGHLVVGALTAAGVKYK